MKITEIKKIYHKHFLAFWVATRLLVGFLLIISAIRMYSSVKLDFELMLESLKVPGFLTNIIWVLLRWAKLYVGGFLILGIFTRASAIAAAIFHGISVFALAYIKFAGIKIYSSPCSVVSYGNCNFALVFNMSLIILSAAIYFFNSDKLTFDGWVKKQE
jgi:uncharacterized membrane protein YphA (DoxX/SURF4 family)